MYTSLVRYHFARFGVEYSGNESYYKDLIKIKDMAYPGISMEEFTYLSLGYKSESDFNRRKSVMLNTNEINNLKKHFNVKYKSDVIDILNDDDLVPVHIMDKQTVEEMFELFLLNRGLVHLGVSNLVPCFDTGTKLKKNDIRKCVELMSKHFKVVKVGTSPRVSTSYIYTTLDKTAEELFGAILTVNGLSHELNTLVGLDFNSMSNSDFKCLVDLSLLFNCTIETLYSMYLIDLGDFDTIYRNTGNIIGFGRDGYTRTTLDSKKVYKTTLDILDINKSGGFGNVYFD